MLEVIKEHKQNMNKILNLAKVDLVRTYRGANLGWAWAVLKPVIQIFVYWFTFAIGLRVSKEVKGYPYFLWLVASTVPWFYISAMITGGADSMRQYSYLITKMKFPISIIPTVVNVSKFIVHAILIMIVIGIFRWKGYGIDGYTLQLGIYMLLSFLFLEIWSLLSSTISVISRDFLNLVKSINSAIFWLSGIVWDITTVKVSWIRKLLWFNPVTFLINGYRNCFINKVYIWEQPQQLLAFLCSMTILTILATICYKKLRKDIPDVL